jgi:hypothetical protein
MPATHYQPGDSCSCSVFLCNPDDEILDQVPLFVILDVAGELFFAPDYEGVSYYEVDLPAGETETVVVSSFSWPVDCGSAQGVRWISAMTDQEITHIQGKMDDWEFGWSQ